MKNRIQNRFETKNVNLTKEYLIENLSKIVYFSCVSNLRYDEWHTDVKLLLLEDGKLIWAEDSVYDDEYYPVGPEGKNAVSFLMTSKETKKLFNIFSETGGFCKDADFEFKNGGCLISSRESSEESFCAFVKDLEIPYSLKKTVDLSQEAEDLIEKFVDENGLKNFTEEECALIYALREPRINIWDWMNAVRYIRYANGEIFNFSSDDESMCLESLWRFRLAYLKEKTKNINLKKMFAGKKVENNVLEDFVKKYFIEGTNHKTNLIDELLNVFHEDLRKVFSKTEIADFDDFRLEVNNFNSPFLDNETNVFAYPKLIKFSDVDDEKICEQILKLGYSDIDRSAEDIYCYLANYLEFYDKKAYAKILPVAFYIIELGDPTQCSREFAELFWMASEIVNEYWKILPEDEKTQADFRKKIYQAYWSKVGDVWPIKNLGKFDFRSRAGQKIFNEAIGWILCLDDICELNKGLGKYLKEISKKIDVSSKYQDLNRMVIATALKLSVQNETDLNWFEKLNSGPYGRQFEILTNPRTIGQARLVAKEGLRDNDFDLLERLLITGNPEKVGEGLIDFVAANLPKDNKGLDIVAVFTAACTGASNKNELEPLRKFADGLKAMEFAKKMPELVLKIDNGLKLAEKNVKAAEFQRENLWDFEK